MRLVFIASNNCSAFSVRSRDQRGDVSFKTKFFKYSEPGVIFLPLWLVTETFHLVSQIAEIISSFASLRFCHGDAQHALHARGRLVATRRFLVLNEKRNDTSYILFCILIHSRNNPGEPFCLGRLFPQ